VKVAAIIVTRGDQDLLPIWASLPSEWTQIEWDNSREANDVSVYGRYAAIERTDAELIYVQDDDCIVSDPEFLVRAWLEAGKYPFDGRGSPWGADPRDAVDHIVCNMPYEFRHGFYTEHALVGFGAAFHRDAPARAFQRMRDGGGYVGDIGWANRTCDIVFTALSPVRLLVNVPYADLPWAHYESRMWKQPGHVAERVKMLELVRAVAAA
jgi:hypothetical protein